MDLREIGLGVCGLDPTVSEQGPVAGCCECGDEPSGSCATELVIKPCIYLFMCTRVEFNFFFPCNSVFIYHFRYCLFNFFRFCRCSTFALFDERWYK
jgi:hypothetical protein